MRRHKLYNGYAALYRFFRILPHVCRVGYQVALPVGYMDSYNVGSYCQPFRFGCLYSPPQLERPYRC